MFASWVLKKLLTTNRAHQKGALSACGTYIVLGAWLQYDISILYNIYTYIHILYVVMYICICMYEL